MFFALYGGVQVATSYTQLIGSANVGEGAVEPLNERIKKALLTATNAMNFAPMLAILFIGARMRALQMDPVNGSPQKWAQNCFYMCTYAVAAQVLLSIVVPLVLQGQAKVGKT